MTLEKEFAMLMLKASCKKCHHCFLIPADRADSVIKCPACFDESVANLWQPKPTHPKVQKIKNTFRPVTDDLSRIEKDLRPITHFIGKCFGVLGSMVTVLINSVFGCLWTCCKGYWGRDGPSATFLLTSPLVLGVLVLIALALGGYKGPAESSWNSPLPRSSSSSIESHEDYLRASPSERRQHIRETVGDSNAYEIQKGLDTFYGIE